MYNSNSLWIFDARSESGGGLYPTIRREVPGGGDSDEERGSGEYYSGEEFREDDIMITRDRYSNSSSVWRDLRTDWKQKKTRWYTDLGSGPAAGLLPCFFFYLFPSRHHLHRSYIVTSFISSKTPIDSFVYFHKKRIVKFLTFRFHRLSNKELDAEGDFDLEVSTGNHLPDDDDQQLIYQESRRSPLRWFLPSPQGERPQYNNCIHIYFIYFYRFADTVRFDSLICYSEEITFFKLDFRWSCFVIIFFLTKICCSFCLRVQRWKLKVWTFLVLVFSLSLQQTNI